MVRERLRRVLDRVRDELHASLRQDSTPRAVAGSFATGTFITMLPTLGVGLLVFVVIAKLVGWVNRIALLASVLVFNPVVKWGVYAASMALGIVLLGPVEGVGPTDASLDAGSDILLRLLVGNLILAVLVTIPAYVIVYRLAVRYRASEVGEIVDGALEEIAETVADE